MRFDLQKSIHGTWKILAFENDNIVGRVLVQHVTGEDALRQVHLWRKAYERMHRGLTATVTIDGKEMTKLRQRKAVLAA